MSDRLYWTPTRCRKVTEAWQKEVNGIQPEVVIQWICRETGMKHVSSPRQLTNATLMFYDEEFGEFYALYLHSGYVRRAIGAWYGSHRIDVDWSVDKFKVQWYQLNKKKTDLKCHEWTTPSGEKRESWWRSVKRIRMPYNAHDMAQTIVRAHKIRHHRNYVNERGFVWPLSRDQWGTDPAKERRELSI